MLNPMVMTRLSDILRQGAVMKRAFQPYEAHLQYLLQWMADYNLYGCGFIDSKMVSFRSPVPQYDELDNLSHLWHGQSIPNDLITHDAVLPRVSHCAIEIDICVQDIMNRKDVKPRPLHHDFIERLNPLAPDEKLVHSMAGLWRDETRRRKSKMSNSDPGSSPFPPEVMISMSADPRNSQPGGWVHETEYRETMQSLIAEEKSKSDGANLTFQNFVQSSSFESSVRTSLEAVEDLYPENLASALGVGSGNAVGTVTYTSDGVAGTDVDENRILGIIHHDDDDDELQYDSDEEMIQEIELSQQKQKDKLEEGHSGPSHSQRHELDPEHSLQSSFDTYAFPGVENAFQATSDVQSSSRSTKSDTNSPNDYQKLQPDREFESSIDLATEGTNHQCIQVQKRTIQPNGSLEIENKRRKLFPDAQDCDPTSTNICIVPDKLSVQILSTHHNQKTAGLHRPNPQSTDLSKVLKLRTPTANALRPASATGTTKHHSSQESLKSSQPSLTNPLPFPVTKDTHDSTMSLRLSQRSI